MTSGKMCIMACPILEDEMVHNLQTDDENGNVYVLTNPHTKTLIPKLDEAEIGYTMVDEQDFLNGSVNLPDDTYSVIIWMMDMGLHEEPENLKDEIHRLLMSMDEKVDSVLLYYGLCGRAFTDIDDWSRENMSVPVSICKDAEGRICDDCICVPLGGTDSYLRLLKRYPGVLYLTPAMACSFDDFRDSMDIFKGLDDSDSDMLKMLLDMAGYTRALTIQTGLGDQRNFRQSAERCSDNLGLRLVDLEDGWTSTEVADRVYEEAKSRIPLDNRPLNVGD